MHLDILVKRPFEALQYLERYVNDGSPSGFTEQNKTSSATDPFGFSPWFHLYTCHGPRSWFTTYGEIPSRLSITCEEDESWILIHPDLIEETEFKHSQIHIELLDTYRFVPTSSARTVQLKSKQAAHYIKLHYNRILGRVNRALPYNKAIAGPEINCLIASASDEKKLHPKLTLLPEVGARIIHIPETNKNFEAGMVWRLDKPYGQIASEISRLLPFFSLFSVDRLAPFDPPLLVQLIQQSKLPPVEFVLNYLFEPIIGGYFSLVCELGLQVEWNAQNVLVGLDNQLKIVSIVMRDMGEIEKDLTLRSSLGLSTSFDSAPYKCIDVEQGDLYNIRHSFAFDFKVGEYLLEPIVELLASEYNIDTVALRNAIKGISKPYQARLPEDFFPKDGKWYTHERILLDGARPYVAVEAPKFR